MIHKALMNDQIRGLVKSISSNLIRAQREEQTSTPDIANKDLYLDKASSDSVYLAKMLFEMEDYNGSSRYFLSAANSYESAQAISQSIACYEKIIEIGISEFIDEARDGLSRVNNLRIRNINLSTKEDRIKALDLLVWEHLGLSTTSAIKLFLDEFGLDVSATSIIAYSHELDKRKRITLWGGPQGREYHMYPNIADLATRKQYYGKQYMFKGYIENRITENFNINYKNLDYNKELFVLNGSIKPKMIVAIDEDAFVRNIEKFVLPKFLIKAFGTLKRFADLTDNGYEASLGEELDVIDSNKLVDGENNQYIYERAVSGDHIWT